ncbi:MAG TPA: GNAT family N-acetyltransferase [Bacilli bacterium]|nr:GNAT family N-acetyltransferase [Bacilli bacterium]
MIIQIYSLNRNIEKFIDKIMLDGSFSDPMLSSPEQLKRNLIKPMNSKDYKVFCVNYDSKIAGLFSFLILPNEKYIEMLVGLSKNKEVYKDVLEYLKQNYFGYNVDFVFNPGNRYLKEILIENKAKFEKEQIKMKYKSECAIDYNNEKIVAYDNKYFKQYNDIHSKDMYWTADRVVLAKNKFKTLLAINNENVIGYIDFTYCFDENEPYDLFVIEEQRGKGYGEALLRKALEVNKNKEMMLLVDFDNDVVINLCKKVGFVVLENCGSLTAQLNLLNG